MPPPPRKSSNLDVRAAVQAVRHSATVEAHAVNMVFIGVTVVLQCVVLMFVCCYSRGQDLATKIPGLAELSEAKSLKFKKSGKGQDALAAAGKSKDDSSESDHSDEESEEHGLVFAAPVAKAARPRHGSDSDSGSDTSVPAVAAAAAAAAGPSRRPSKQARKPTSGYASGEF